MMKRVCVLAVLGLAGSVLAQESDVTTVKTTETQMASGADLLAPLWFVTDATPKEAGQVDLRFNFRWVTDSIGTKSRRGGWWNMLDNEGGFWGKRRRGNGDDDFFLTPAIVWGVAENFELSVTHTSWLGDGGRPGVNKDGNYDSGIGFLWRFVEQDGAVPAIAMGSNFRIPTGARSNKIDADVRLVLSNEYDSGVRSHINGFVGSVNGDNDPNARHFQWGFVFGLDGPLCSDGTVRWVADYMHRSSYHYGESNVNMLELGWEWAMSEAHKLGMSFQIGLDDNGDTPNFGTGLTYAYTIGL